jgi:hypothetical protein
MLRFYRIVIRTWMGVNPQLLILRSVLVRLPKLPCLLGASTESIENNELKFVPGTRPSLEKELKQILVDEGEPGRDFPAPSTGHHNE